MAPNDPNISKTGQRREAPIKGTRSRREFLTTASAVGALSVVGGSLGAQDVSGPPTQLQPISKRTRPNWHIEAVRVEQQFGDGSIIPFFRFASVGQTQSAGLLPLLRSITGRRVAMRISNTLNFAVQPTIVGYVTGPVVQPGQTVDWKLMMPAPGTWLVTDALLGLAAGPVGFGATLISLDKPAGSNFSDPVYDRNYTLLYQDTDDRWNLAVDAGQAPDTNLYEPNYHTINGLTYPNTIVDPDTMLECSMGDDVLIRMGNLGHVRHSIHFHGYHADLIFQNRVPETMLPSKDTFPLPGYATAEIVLPIVQPGVYPLHPHSLASTTDNGLYPFGQITLINASA